MAQPYKESFDTLKKHMTKDELATHAAYMHSLSEEQQHQIEVLEKDNLELLETNKHLLSASVAEKDRYDRVLQQLVATMERQVNPPMIMIPGDKEFEVEVAPGEMNVVKTKSYYEKTIDLLNKDNTANKLAIHKYRMRAYWFFIAAMVSLGGHVITIVCYLTGN